MQDRYSVLSLCTGIGGLEIGLRLAGLDTREVLYVEREAFAVACLDAAIEAGILDDAPVWPDLTTLDGSLLAGKVDIVTAGFPCQPFSVAGKKKRTKDERWIWPDIARIIREVGPRLVFLENVPGLLAGGLGHVLGDLASCGFDAEWDVFSAGAMGAGHKRERLFILAHARCLCDGKNKPKSIIRGRGTTDDSTGREIVADTDRGGWQVERIEMQGRGDDRPSGDEPDGCDGAGCNVAYPDPQGLEGRGREDAERADEQLSGQRGKQVVDAKVQPVGAGLCESGQRGQRGGRSGDADLPAFPPGPGDAAAWQRILDRWPELAPAVADAKCDRGTRGRSDGGSGGEFQHLSRDGNGEQEAKPPIRGALDGLPSRVDRLRALGNGVVPVVAAHAFRSLARRAGCLE